MRPGAPNKRQTAEKTYINRRVAKHRFRAPPVYTDRTPLHTAIATDTWKHARGLPHTIDWTDAEWLTLREACLLLDGYYHRLETGTSAPTSMLTLAHRHLNNLGYTADARQRLNIVYTEPTDKPKTTKTTTPQPNPTGEVLNFRRLG